ncbi:radical SAM protein [Pseudenhygromyxa sp. WMMC2535]|uniref:B12-binding domain-containing radical SAM protein n=1 Tax=Pseudenhygromyxa sp. WMMC2535 TaxID=2712867 RepID=UPI00155801BC|nr:radical SAM protein [Pseudenhygromyxa sp. WMMC2535]NVB41289.1 radical SAM protein [Pseudenhygromyxa sp. WMMC2535]
MKRAPHLVLIKPPLRLPRASYTTLTCPPLGLAYLAASAERAGFEVTVIDAVGAAPRQLRALADPRFLRLGLSDEALLRQIPDDADVIGVTAMFSEEWPMIRGVLQAIRRAFPNTPIIAGGEHISAAPEFSLRDAAGALDVCVLGEGEESLVALVRALSEALPLTEVAGLAFLDESGQLVRTPPRPRMTAIDDIPPPAWHLIPLENYLDHGLGFGIGRRRSVPMLATRGCPYACTFCSNPQMWGRRWVSRSPAAVVAEMSAAVERYGAQNFDFYDLTAMLRKDWVLEFCERVVAAKLGVSFQIPSGTRSEVLDDEVLGALQRAGCNHLVYAPESGSPAVLKRIKKQVDLERMKDSMSCAVARGMTVKCNFIVGFPDETLDEILATLRYCRALARAGVHDINLGPFCPYPGAALHDALRDQGQLPAMGDDYFDMLAIYSDLSRSVSFNARLSSRQLAGLRRLGMVSFYGEAFARHPLRALHMLQAAISGEHRTRLDRVLGDLGRRLLDTRGDTRGDTREDPRARL